MAAACLLGPDYVREMYVTCSSATDSLYCGVCLTQSRFRILILTLWSIYDQAILEARNLGAGKKRQTVYTPGITNREK